MTYEIEFTPAPFERVRVATTSAQRSALRESGFIHVTGLRYYRSLALNSPFAGFDLKASDLGTFWTNYRGYVVIVSQGGEVWLGAPSVAGVRTAAVKTALDLYGENKNPGGLDEPSWYRLKDLLARNANPDYVPSE